MTKKRLATSVVIRDNLVVQSFGFERYLPIGKPEIVVENLSWWGSDEIIIFDIISGKNRIYEPNFEMIKKICNKKLSTPITFAGRIKNTKDAVRVINSGVERVGLGDILLNDHDKIKKISDAIGTQAVVLILNLLFINRKLYVRDIKKKINIPYEDIENYLFILKDYYSEILIVDILNEGSNGNFNIKILEKVNIKKKKIIYGGMFDINKIKKLLKNKLISSIAIGNQFNFKEHAYQKLKLKLKTQMLRPEFYNN